MGKIASVIENPDLSYYIKIEPFVDGIQGERTYFDYVVVADEFWEELHFVKEGIRYIYEVEGDDVLFYKTSKMKDYQVVEKTQENKPLFIELFSIYQRQNKKYGKWITQYANNHLEKLKLELKFSFGNWSITSKDKSGKKFLVVGFSDKGDAQKTYDGLWKSENVLQDIKDLKSGIGPEKYGKFLNK